MNFTLTPFIRVVRAVVPLLSTRVRKPHGLADTQLAERQTPITRRNVLGHRNYLRKQSIFRYFSVFFATLSSDTFLTSASNTPIL
ncbi:hypothetical protein [Mycobacterium sp. 1164966.3]|uniref:hypothetical protein n=1 Tax=Mycobacterium sp. 1164966.3 TaxID=1856861 RepID=UPI0015600C9E|nr:hypothetical protein [Mycobacterium sp. 1164966.3]